MICHVFLNFICNSKLNQNKYKRVLHFFFTNRQLEKKIGLNDQINVIKFHALHFYTMYKLTTTI